MVPQRILQVLQYFRKRNQLLFLVLLWAKVKEHPYFCQGYPEIRFEATQEDLLPTRRRQELTRQVEANNLNDEDIVIKC